MIGPWLAEKRLALSLFQKDVAERAGISPQYINDIESNRRTPTRHTLRRICDAIGADYDAACFLAGWLPDDLTGTWYPFGALKSTYQAIRKNAEWTT